MKTIATRRVIVVVIVAILVVVVIVVVVVAIVVLVVMENECELTAVLAIHTDSNTTIFIRDDDNF